MKLVINSCFGGFGLSPAALQFIAKLQGRECYFFRQEGFKGPYISVDPTDPSAPNGIMQMLLAAFDIPNPNEVLPQSMNDLDKWYAMTPAEREASSKLYEQHRVSPPDDRADPFLVRAVEELGSEAASGACAKLKVIEIPDGTQYELDEYDGIESVHEVHASWN